jgi:glycosyltransferase involved in cell wall biosynthesis
LRIAVVTPFLDRQHGAERCLVEQIEYFLGLPDIEVHIYAQAVKDVDVTAPWLERETAGVGGNKAIWHRISKLPGPHLFNFIWWFLANTAVRWFHKRFRGLHYDVIYSAGINCLDADAVVVHVVFQQFFRHVREDLRLGCTPVRSWPATIHRHIYYRLIIFLESLIYTRRELSLGAVSHLTAQQIACSTGRTDVTVIPNGVDLASFNPEQRFRRRDAARKALHSRESDFVVLLLGNGWKNKGLRTLLDAVAFCRELPIKVLVVGKDDRLPFSQQIQRLGMESDRIVFSSPSPDVIQFYAAADAYASPSLHDSFALPPLEAMACGLPVITSKQNGGAQAITDGVDGYVLEDPQDALTLAGIIRGLATQPEVRRSVGSNGACVAKSYTWERNARDTLSFLLAASRLKETR